MRIAVCADGRSTHAKRWANGVAARGHEVALIWRRDEFVEADLPSFAAAITHHVYTPATTARPWMIPLAVPAARRLAWRLRPDLAHGLFLSGHGWAAHGLGVRPLVLSAFGSDLRDLATDEDGSAFERLVHAYIVRRTRAAVAAADVVLADSSAAAEVVRDRVPGTPTRIIRFGADLVSPPESARSSWRRRLGVDDGAFVVLSSRLMRPLYNIDTIIRALPAIRRRVPAATLVVKEVPRFAYPDYRRRCLELIDELGLGDAVRTVGELDHDELVALYAAADVYVSVPDSDATAVSVFEAMAAGVAVVASDAPGTDPAILRQRETALLVRPGDPEALASAVVALGVDADLRRDVTERAREIVTRHGDFERELDRAVLLYEQLVAARRAREAQ
jgi:glycosyltransferase involved in cell wall biosynthesis